MPWEGFSIFTDEVGAGHLMRILQIRTGARARCEVWDDDDPIQGTWIKSFSFKKS